MEVDGENVDDYDKLYGWMFHQRKLRVLEKKKMKNEMSGMYISISFL